MRLQGKVALVTGAARSARMRGKAAGRMTRARPVSYSPCG